MKSMVKQLKITIFLLVSFIMMPGNAAATAWTEMTSGTNNALNAVWGNSATDVFAVGYNGTIIHYNGSAWSPMDSGTSITLYGVWGSSAQDVYAVGNNGTIIHYDGSTWLSMSSGTAIALYRAWGSSAENVYVVGEEGIVLHFNGSGWSQLLSDTKSPLSCVWGSSPTDIFAVGYDGTVIHSTDGSAFSEMATETSSFLKGVWGSSSTDVFAVGYNGTILHYDVSNWFEIVTETTADFYGVSGNSERFIFAVGESGAIYFYNGNEWSAMDSGTSTLLLGLWVSQGNDAFAVGKGGIILHYRNAAPVASITLNQTYGYTTTPFSLDASGCSDLEDSTDQLEVRWDWENDGIWDTDYTTEKTTTHQYTAEGTYTIALEVRDTSGQTAIATQQVSVTTNTIPTASFTVSPHAGSSQTTFTVDASKCHDGEDPLEALTVRWDWENDGIWDTSYKTEKTASHQYGANGAFTIRLQVKDTGDFTDSTTQKVLVGACIASSILGEEDPRLVSLRQFRDEVLAKSKMGRELISIYYQHEGAVAKILASNPMLEKYAEMLLEKVLVPAVEQLLEDL